jgi:3-oxoacyl-[acyl-carrier-protein] synthase II
MKRVVITGIGAVTPLGNSIELTWANLTKGLSGIDFITRFDPSVFKVKIAGELKGFSPKNYIPRKDIIRLDPFVHYSAASSLMALEDSGIKPDKLRMLRTAAIIGSSRGGITGIEKALERFLIENKPFSAYLMSSSTINMAASYISILLKTRGPAIGISTACSSGANAIGIASKMIRSGEVDLAFAGGTEAPISKLAVGGYSASGALSEANHKPSKASRPFDRDRDGFVISEGAGTLLLEELEHAVKRGANIYAELSGYGTSSDAFHLTRPDSEGEAIAIEMALKDANVSAEEVDYINPHATSTILGDKAESDAIRNVFGSRTQDIQVSSCKSMLGHMLGAAGAVEAAMTALTIKKELITPTINLDHPDPDCSLKHVTSSTSKKINIAVSNSFGFGGVNAVLVFNRFDA